MNELPSKTIRRSFNSEVANNKNKIKCRLITQIKMYLTNKHKSRIGLNLINTRS